MRPRSSASWDQDQRARMPRVTSSSQAKREDAAMSSGRSPNLSSARWSFEWVEEEKERDPLRDRREPSGREQKQKRKGEREPEAGLHDVLSARQRAVRARAHRHRDPERDDEEQDQQDEPDDRERACHEPHASTGAFIGAGSSAGPAGGCRRGRNRHGPPLSAAPFRNLPWTSMRRRLRKRFESCPVGRGLSRCARGRQLAGQAGRRPDGANATTSSRGHKATPSRRAADHRLWRPYPANPHCTISMSGRISPRSSGTGLSGRCRSAIR